MDYRTFEAWRHRLRGITWFNQGRKGPGVASPRVSGKVPAKLKAASEAKHSEILKPPELNVGAVIIPIEFRAPLQYNYHKEP